MTTKPTEELSYKLTEHSDSWSPAPPSPGAQTSPPCPMPLWCLTLRFHKTPGCPAQPSGQLVPWGQLRSTRGGSLAHHCPSLTRSLPPAWLSGDPGLRHPSPAPVTHTMEPAIRQRGQPPTHLPNSTLAERLSSRQLPAQGRTVELAGASGEAAGGILLNKAPH